MKRFYKKHAKEHVLRLANVQENLYLCNRQEGVKATTSKNGATSNQQNNMKETTITCTTLMWYAVDKDGWGKLFRNRPARLKSIRAGVGQTEPNLLIPDAETSTGRKWEYEPTLEQVTYEITI